MNKSATVSAKTPAPPRARFWSNTRHWSGKGFFALLDQGLISGSNFLIAILLARQLTLRRYGAFALALEVFLFLGVVYGALVLEPLSVFGSSVYRDQLRVYVRRLLGIHGVIAAVLLSATGLGAWIFYRIKPGNELAPAVAGVAIAAPLLLLFWLARRVIYVQLNPRQAARGAAVYFAVLVGGLLIVRSFHLLSPMTAFLLMGAGGAVAAALILMRLRPTLGSNRQEPTTLEALRRHWNYGRWSLASAVMIWLSGAIFYPLLASFHGLADAGEFKALMNFASPIGQVFAALSLLSLPYAARAHYEKTGKSPAQLAWKLTLLYGGGTLMYWVLVVAVRQPLVAHLYAGKYLNLIPLLPWVAVGSVLRISATAQAITLRAMHAPAMVFAAYSAASVSALAIGVPCTWAFGLHGAVLAMVLSSAVATLAAWVMVRSRNKPIAQPGV